MLVSKHFTIELHLQLLKELVLNHVRTLMLRDGVIARSVKNSPHKHKGPEPLEPLRKEKLCMVDL